MEKINKIEGELGYTLPSVVVYPTVHYGQGEQVCVIFVASHYFPSYQYIGVEGGVILLTMTMGE